MEISFCLYDKPFALRLSSIAPSVGDKIDFSVERNLCHYVVISRKFVFNKDDSSRIIINMVEKLD